MVCRVGGRLRLDSCSSIPPDRAKEKIQWYFRKSFIIFAVCSVEPLALPLMWWRPQTTRAWKIGLTISLNGKTELMQNYEHPFPAV